MKYLFLDCEFASSKGRSEKICEFGYVMTDESFNVIFKGNFIINPDIQDNEWDWWALKNILTRSKAVYKNKYTFPTFYGRIATMIKEADYVIGHTLSSDVHALNCEFKRYSLPSIDFDFYDIANMSKEISDSKDKLSVEDMVEVLKIEGDSSIHDAGADAFNTMLVLKAILKKTNLTLGELLEKYPNSKDRTENFEINSMVKAREVNVKRREEMMKGDYSDGTNIIGPLRRFSNKKTFLRFLDNVTKTSPGNGKFEGKKISIGINYESEHFKEMMNLVQIITNEGGEYVLKGSLSDIFVTYQQILEDGSVRDCNREKYVDIAISEGKPILKITFDEFLKIIGLTNEELEALPLPSIECMFKKDSIIKDKKFLKKYK